MKKTIITLLSTLVSVLSFAAIPSWSVDETQFSGSMTITGIVSINGIEASDKDDIVAAFVGNECRGVAHLLPSTELGKAYAYLMIFSNGAANEVLHFEVYDSRADEVFAVADTMTFVADNSIGTQAIPYVFANKSLGQTTIDSLSTGIEGEKVTINQDARTILLSVPDSISIAKIPIDFVSSLGTVVKLNTLVLKPGDTLDLTSDVVVSVVSQNGETTSWRIVTTKNPVLLSGNDILSYGVTVPGASVSIDRASRHISINVPANISATKFQTNFTLSQNARLFIDTLLVSNGDYVNYSDTVTYAVLAENGNLKQWTVILTRPLPVVPDSGNAILAFGVDIAGAAVAIDAGRKAITINVPALATTKAATNFTVSTDARVFVNSVEVKSGAVVDYASVVTFVVVSESGDTSLWMAKTTTEDIPVDTLQKGTDILSFGVNISGATVSVAQASKTISIQVPFDAPARAAVSFSLSQGARLFVGARRVSFGDELSLAADTALTVVSESETSATWKLSFTRLPEPLDTGYALLSFGVDISGAVIDKHDGIRVINITVPKQATSTCHTSFSLSKDATLLLGTEKVAYGALIDYSKPVVLSVVSEAGKIVTWIVTVLKTLDVVVDSTSNILSFGINIDGASSVVDTVAKTVVVSVPADAASKGASSFTISQGAKLLHGKTAVKYGDTLDLTTPLVLSVVSASGDTASWTISLSRAVAQLDTGKTITALAVDIQDATVVIDEAKSAVVVSVATSAPSFSATTFTLSENSSLFIGNKEIQFGDIIDYTQPVLATVKAQDGSKRQWTLSFVRPVVVPDSGNAILSFGVDVAGSSVNIDAKTKSISVYVSDKAPARCVTSFLVSRNATLAIDNKSYASGDTIDYTSPVTITVTAQNGTASTWTARLVRPIIEPEPIDTGKALVSFSITATGSFVSIDKAIRQITILVPNDASSLVFTTSFALSTDAKLLAGTTLLTTDSLVDYATVNQLTVVAEDGSTSVWNVVVKRQTSTSEGIGNEARILITPDAIQLLGFTTLVELNIVDATGRVIIHEAYAATTIDTRSLPRGVYHLVLRDSKRVVVRSFVK